MILDALLNKSKRIGAVDSDICFELVLLQEASSRCGGEDIVIYDENMRQLSRCVSYPEGRLANFLFFSKSFLSLLRLFNDIVG